jgi:hypothetical protein
MQFKIYSLVTSAGKITFVAMFPPPISCHKIMLGASIFLVGVIPAMSGVRNNTVSLFQGI